ncbi:peptidyl-prolyl cis-trans isomerase [Sinimarinibacterium flocculans]|uniref:peptidylprolyl isomerase n=1 Tax=Sinimarinibacterium flocculans TaxID=985250 RepID=UPI00351170E9
MKPSRLRTVAREPLMQFLLAGAVLLGANRLLSPAQAEDPGSDRITVSQPMLAAMRASFIQASGHEPDRAEMQALIDRRVDAEVLYREALRLGLHLEDVIVRREMERKMRFVIEDLDPLPEPTPDDLQRWLDTHAEQYAEPATVSFDHVFVSRARHGVQLPFVAAERLASLREQPDAFAGLGDPLPAGAQVVDADRQRLEKDFGRPFADAVLGLPQGPWSEPLQSSLGLHLVRITGRRAGRAVSVEQAGKRLVVDVRAAQREAANRRALERLRERYRVEVAGEPGTAS